MFANWLSLLKTDHLLYPQASSIVQDDDTPYSGRVKFRSVLVVKLRPHIVRDQINRKIGYCISSQTNTATLRNFESFLGTSLGRTCLETMTFQIIAERKFYDLSIYFSIFSI